MRATHHINLILCVLFNMMIQGRVQIMKLLITNFCNLPVISLDPQIFSPALCSQTPSIYVITNYTLSNHCQVWQRIKMYWKQNIIIYKGAGICLHDTALFLFCNTFHYMFRSYTVEPHFYVPIIYLTHHLQHFFKSLQFQFIMYLLFTSILHIQNFKLPTIYIFRALTEGTILT
jgi:hypothetical protein